MKQKKWITWLLGVLVVGIWGLIMQRVFSGMGDRETPQIKQAERSSDHEKLPELQPDTFRLALNYPDPFTGEPSAEKPVGHPVSGPVKTVAPAQPLTAVAPAPPDPMEQVSYLGFVQNPESKKRVAILNAGGKEMMMSEGEHAGPLQLIRISGPEITIKYKNKLKQIKQRP